MHARWEKWRTASEPATETQCAACRWRRAFAGARVRGGCGAVAPSRPWACVCLPAPMPLVPRGVSGGTSARVPRLPWDENEPCVREFGRYDLRQHRVLHRWWEEDLARFVACKDREGLRVRVVVAERAKLDGVVGEAQAGDAELKLRARTRGGIQRVNRWQPALVRARAVCKGLSPFLCTRR